MRKIHTINYFKKASFSLFICFIGNAIICIAGLLLDVYYIVRYGYLPSLWSGYLGLLSLMLVSIVLMLCFDNIATNLSASLEPLPEPLKEPISAYHGDTLNEVMEALRNERLEYDSVFDRSGRKIAEGTLFSPEHCNLTSAGYGALRNAGNYCFSLHNHPSLREVPFSKGDWKWFIGHSECSTMIVVTTHFTYIAEKPIVISIDQKEFSEYIDQLFEQLPKTFWSYEQERRYYIKMTKQIADHCGFKFVVEDLRRPQITVRRAAMRALNTIL